jgi:hypothetical protein
MKVIVQPAVVIVQSKNIHLKKSFKMENTINFGIDLGTTNSAIAKFVKGEVIIFSNPQDYGRNTYLLLFHIKKIKSCWKQSQRSF